jgi:hypothetical protein
MGPDTTMHYQGGESTHRSQTLCADHLSESAGVRDGLDQQSGGQSLAPARGFKTSGYLIVTLADEQQGVTP